MWVLSSYLKEVKQEFRNVNFRLSKIKVKLDGFERVSEQLQTDIRILKLQSQFSEAKGRFFENVINLHEQDMQDISDNLEGVEEIVENLDNTQRKNNIKLKGLKEGTEEKNLLAFLTELFIYCMAWG